MGKGVNLQIASSSQRMVYLFQTRLEKQKLSLLCVYFGGGFLQASLRLEVCGLQNCQWCEDVGEFLTHSGAKNDLRVWRPIYS